MGQELSEGTVTVLFTDVLLDAIDEVEAARERLKRKV